MTRLLVGQNMIHGSIPYNISNLVNLNMLGITNSLISGTIPDSIGMLSNLKRLHLESNQLRGKIPSSLGNIKEILYIFLQDNKLGGNIPPSLGNCRFLQRLDLSSNNLTGAIPKEVIGISSLSIVLNISQNFLTGPLPEEVGNLTNLAALDLSNNKISGTIPTTLGNCLALEVLSMQGNSFEGTIPANLNNLKNIQFLDISNNKLSGRIPEGIAKLSSLLFLNLSFNNLEGEIRAQGVFGDSSRIEVSGNEKLCGGIVQLHLQPCPREAPRKAKHTALKVILIIVILGSGLTLLVLLLSFFWMKKVRNKTISASSTVDMHMKVSYKDLLNATGGFSLHNLIGSGNFGTVYRGTLGPDGTEVAVKVIKLQQRGASKSFLAECQVLRTIRHRNLVKILTACSSTDFHGNEFKALVYQYMPNENLEKWLHPDDGHIAQSLSIFQRVNILIDVALALHYLHNQCTTPVAHCDLKPNNVLLDDDLTAHVSDFGLAKLLLNSPEDANLNQFSSLGVKGTIGYAAPEYGMGSQVSTEGDVYSFGILLLETFTGRRPTDALFKDNANLHSFVQQALPDQVMEIVDQSALYKEEPGDLIETRYWESYSRIELREGLISLFRIGLKCSEQAPQDRMSMMQVPMDLISVREKLNRQGAHEGNLKK